MTTLSTLETAATAVYLARLKDESRGRATFRDSLANMTTLLIADALAQLGDPEEVVFVPLLRGGLGMDDGALVASPNAAVGHIGVYRDPTSHDVVEYYSKVPRVDGAAVFILDPMIASGGTAFAAASSLASVGYERVHIATVVASTTAVDLLSQQDVVGTIFTCAVDEGEPGVGSLPDGLGDAGARLYGTP